MERTTRRTFLLSSLSAAAAAAGLHAQAPPDANGRLRVAQVGLGGRSEAITRCLLELARENVEIAAVCDVDEPQLQRRAAAIGEASGRRPATFTDMRRVFDDGNIDAVFFTTPNHWHALGTIWACQAGKDVYVEKPGCHNIHEGRRMVEAARRYDRLVQHGTQCRSSPMIRESIRRLQEGVVGRVYMARGVAYKVRPPIGRVTRDPLPAGFDHDRWLGPAPRHDYSRTRRTRWHNFWDYGNGEIGNQGVHQMDVIRWGLRLDGHPTRAQSMGGALIHEDDQETPSTQVASFQWAGQRLLVDFAVRNGFTNTEAGMGDDYPFVDNRSVVGAVFYGTEGYMVIPDYSSYRTFLGADREPGPMGQDREDPMMDLPHVRNFVQAVRSRRRADLTAEIEEGFKSAALCHLANIAYRLGRTVNFDPGEERFPGDDEANALLTRPAREGYAVPDRV